MLYLYSLLFSITLFWQPDNADILIAHEAANEYRLNHRRDSLSLDSALCAVAQVHSKNMATKKVRFGHSGFKNRTDELEKLGKGSAFGENVYYSSKYADGQEAVDAWINSREHRNNLKNKTYTKVGYGVATDKSGGTYYTQIFSN